MSNFQSVAPSSLWKRVSRSILASQNEDVIVEPEAGLRALWVLATIYNQTEDKYLTFNVTISKKDGTWCYVISGRLGDQIARVISVTESSGLVSLNIANSETFELKFSAAYLKNI